MTERSPKRLRDIPFLLGYTSEENDLVNDFYIPCLSAATHYRRAAGYFRSSLYVALGIAYSDYGMKGGKIQLVCSPSLTDADISALRSGYEEREVVGARTLDDVRTLLKDVKSSPVTEFLATLVSCGVLDLRIAYRSTQAGIFHQKIGIFEDYCGDHISFTGSANETYSAWDIASNSESFDVFESWQQDSARRVDRHLDYFNRLWQGNLHTLVVKEFPDAAREHLLSVSNSDGIDEAATKVRQLTSNWAPRIQIPAEPANTKRVLQPHQAAVLQHWQTSKCRGIVSHVTGSGKTVTALSAIRKWGNSGKPIVVLVPSDLLAKQWAAEIVQELSDLAPTVVTAGAGTDRSKWEPVLADMTRDMPELGMRITIATLQTASKVNFIARVQSGKHLLVVADEVHRIGSVGNAAILTIEAGGRLGLSATPERFGDPEGTRRILDYFGSALLPTFGIPEAIEAGRLVPYDYFVHEVRLESSEQEEWDALTDRIRREYARLPKDRGGQRVHTNGFKLLLFKRAAILKQATGKLEVAKQLLGSSYNDGDRWLVYCDSQEQLGQVLGVLQELNLPALEYHTAMDGDRVATMDHFTAQGGVMVAIRCLDEGIDIPSVGKALILASSQNSREFIQRRGRVLRSHQDKRSAQVHDCIVLPAVRSSGEDSDVAIVKIELRRAKEFAEHARNRAVALELAVLARRQGLDDFDLATGDFEEANE